jgi:hypothetical protein
MEEKAKKIWKMENHALSLPQISEQNTSKKSSEN